MGGMRINISRGKPQGYALVQSAVPGNKVQSLMPPFDLQQQLLGVLKWSNVMGSHLFQIKSNLPFYKHFCCCVLSYKIVIEMRVIFKIASMRKDFINYLLMKQFNQISNSINSIKLYLEPTKKSILPKEHTFIIFFRLIFLVKA